MYSPIIRDYAKERDIPALLVPLNGCLPTLDTNISLKCLIAARQNYDAISDLDSTKLIIIAHSWPPNAELVDEDGYAVDGNPYEIMANSTVSLAEKFVNQGKLVIIVGPIAMPRFEFASKKSRILAFKIDRDISESKPISEFLQDYDIVIEVLLESGIPLVLPHNVQCSDFDCHYMYDGLSYFADGNHLSEDSLVQFTDIFEASLDKLLQNDRG